MWIEKGINQLSEENIEKSIEYLLSAFDIY